MLSYLIVNEQHLFTLFQQHCNSAYFPIGQLRKNCCAVAVCYRLNPFVTLYVQGSLWYFHKCANECTYEAIHKYVHMYACSYVGMHTISNILFMTDYMLQIYL